MQNALSSSFSFIISLKINKIYLFHFLIMYNIYIKDNKKKNKLTKDTKMIFVQIQQLFNIFPIYIFFTQFKIYYVRRAVVITP